MKTSLAVSKDSEEGAEGAAVITSCATSSLVTSCHVLTAGDNGRGSQPSHLQLVALENVFVFLRPSQGI